MADSLNLLHMQKSSPLLPTFCALLSSIHRHRHRHRHPSANTASIQPNLSLLLTFALSSLLAIYCAVIHPLHVSKPSQYSLILSSRQLLLHTRLQLCSISTSTSLVIHKRLKHISWNLIPNFVFKKELFVDLISMKWKLLEPKLNWRIKATYQYERSKNTAHSRHLLMLSSRAWVLILKYLKLPMNKK